MSRVVITLDGVSLTLTQWAKRRGISPATLARRLKLGWDVRTALMKPVNNGVTVTHKSTYSVWFDMIRRCHDERRRDYQQYGGRGITVCERWRESFETFLEDMGDRPGCWQIDRIDPKLGYSPTNCRWVTAKENARNRICARLVEFRGNLERVADLAERFDIELSALHKRLDLGWDVERAVATSGARPYSAKPNGRREGLAG